MSQSSTDANDAPGGLLIDSVPIPCLTWSPDLRVQSWNPSAERVFGFPRAEVIGRSLPEIPFLPDAVRADVAQALNRVLSREEVLEREIESATKDGRFILCEWTIMPMRENGRVAGLIAMAHDVTQKLQAMRELLLDGKRLERQLALSQLKVGTSEELLAHALEEGMALTGSGTGTLCRYDESTGRLTSDSGRENLAEAGAEVIRTGKPLIRDRVLAAPLFVKGKIVAVVCVANAGSGYTDIDAGQLSLLLDGIGRMISLRETEEALSQAREQLIQSRKMEAIGRLAGGIAHDFNNLLQIMNGHLEALRESVGAVEKVHVSDLKEVVRKAATLISQLLAFSRKSIITPRTIDLNELVTGFAGMFRRVIGENIALTTELAPVPWHVTADQSQIEQVVMNIVVNARDAMPDGGKLAISTRNVRLAAGDQSRYPEAKPGDYVELLIGDTGVGMSEEVQSRIFEPFFTTKPMGKGVGLGLSMVYGIVKQSGAFVTCTSAVGKGTTIGILFPRAASVEPEKAPEGHVAELRKGRETILLVEDNEEVRRMTERFLSRSGYTVLPAGNGEEALEKAEQHAVDLVLTDVVMPGMNGKEVADRLARTLPGLKVIFMSGYPMDVIPGDGAPADRREFLQKPFERDSLLRHVRDVLDAKPGPRRPN